MKKYIHYFRWYLITFAALTVFFIGIVSIRAVGYKMIGHERTNTECLTEERVFDHADVLTDRQEEKLRQLIQKRERQTKCDIAVITINESLAEYVKPYEEQLGHIAVEDYAQVYADNFYDENKMGYDKAYGDGAVLVDNFTRESDGLRYTAFSTSGQAEYQYGDVKIDRMLDKIIEHDGNPYQAYRTYVNQFYADMTGHGQIDPPLSVPMVFLISIVAAVIFILINLSQRKAKDTTTAFTYLNGGNPQMKVKEDRFIRKHVTQRRIETSSGSGGGGGGSSHGGGHHTSSGGHSHGGGSRGR